MSTEITFVHAVSGQFITVNNTTIQIPFKYKKYTTFDLYWQKDEIQRAHNRKPGLIFWDSEGRHEISFKGNKTEFKKYIQPLVTIFNKYSSKQSAPNQTQLVAKIKEIDHRIAIARNREDNELLDELLTERKNIDDTTLVEYCPYCGRTSCADDCILKILN